MIRSGRLATGLFLAIAGAFAAPCAAQAPRTIAVPAIAVWCKPVILARADAERDDKVDSARDGAVEALDKALLAGKVLTSGLPFVLRIGAAPGQDRGADAASPPEQVRLDVCVSVPSGAAAPSAPLERTTLSPGTYAVRACGQESDQDCVERLREALGASLDPAQAEAVRGSPILVTKVAADDGDTALASAFAAARDRATAAAIKVDVTGATSLLASDQPRPLMVSETAALIIAGLPTERTRAAAIKVPQP